MLKNDLYLKTTCNIRPRFLGSMGGLKIEGPLYRDIYIENTGKEYGNCVSDGWS